MKNIVQFICYNPRIYSGFDNFQIRLSKNLISKNYQPILVYSDEINIEKLRNDIIASGAILEFVNTKSFLKLFFSIIRIFVKYKPKIIHSHFENKIHFSVALISKFFGTTYYFSIWSEISKYDKRTYLKKKGYIKYFLLKSYFHFLIYRSAKSFFGSDAIKNQLIQLFTFRSPKIETFYLGTEIYKNEKKIDELKQKFKTPTNQIVLCNISAIEHIKGIHTLIEALALLKNEYKFEDFICYHIGTIRNSSESNIKFYSNLKNKIEVNNLADNFIWLEFIEHITDILKITDIYVHPSLEEGLGSANLEAASQSLPIIASNVGGIPEIVLHNKNGYLFNAESENELAAYLYELITNTELRLKMGNESFLIVNSLFNFTNQITLLNKYYLE